ncbi:MAG: tRNA (adenosine(37)-N6)-threonylcarbamoyltransferase complex ATPase subunit type 1 TsaE [Rhodobacteraceae bacterium]|nr:tRNA (adenosine(37)-N6)-threonylcarbamoyltransferase complex ATPase subunit type 1 TsaE [Paracoccaceae bacterium]
MTFHLATDASTTGFGAVLSMYLHTGDTVLLEGPVGAGKTHLCRSVIQARLAQSGISEDVPSPTFTLLQTYDSGGVEIWHADLYRLNSEEEIFELGLPEAFDTALCLIEWPDRLADMAPVSALTLRLSVTPEDTRNLTLEWTDPRWDNVATVLKDAGQWQW